MQVRARPGKPTVVGYTRNDLDMWLNNVARIACMGGATAEDVAQISFGYGTFTGALGLHGGLGEDRGFCDSDVFGKYEEADYVSAGYGCDASGGYPVLCAPSWRGASRNAGSIPQRI